MKVSKNMKKKIAFMVINMNIGGTEKALLNMIAEIPPETFEITILMLEKKGGFLHEIPDHIQVKYVKGYQQIKSDLQRPPKEIIIGNIKKGRLIKAWMIASLHLLSKITKERSSFYKYLLKNIPSLSKEYDIAVAYAGPMDLISYFIVHKIKARRKIQWIHFDIDKIGFNQQFAAKIYGKFDQLLVVSNEGKRKLSQTLPRLKYKTGVFKNIVSPTIIQEEAINGTGFQDGFSGIRILTVGRLSLEKGQDMAIKVLAKLIYHGYDVRWYCLGDGTARQEYEKMVAYLNIKEHFIFLGSNANPYQYMKHCDIYVQPSRHEGYCITLAEAKILNRPIVTTNFTGAKEQIIDGKTGLIVEFNEEQIYEAIEKVINEPTLGHAFQTNLAKETTQHSIDMEAVLELN